MTRPAFTSPTRRLGKFLALSTLVVLAADAAPARAQEDDPAEVTGVQPSRAYVSLLPWEKIDAYSGSLVLTFTDLVLPGNAGFDFRFTRSYNSKGPERWRVGPGFIRHADSGETPAQNPRLITPDGGVQRTFQAGAESPIFRTLSYWEYDRDTHELTLPNGVVYEYDCAPTSSYTRYPTTARDPFGNTITYSYDSCDPDPEDEPLLQSVSQDLGDGHVRTVTFTYLDGRIRTMTSEGRVWTYTWEGSFLTDVTPPVGSGWRYDHDDTFRVSKVTTPQGGEVSYAFESVTIGTRGTLALTRRETGGRGVPAGCGRSTIIQPAPTSRAR